MEKYVNGPAALGLPTGRENLQKSMGPTPPNPTKKVLVCRTARRELRELWPATAIINRCEDPLTSSSEESSSGQEDSTLESDSTATSRVKRTQARRKRRRTMA